MSRSILKDKFMRRCYKGRSFKSSKWDDPIRNPHRQDEMPKNTPSKLVLMHCSAVVSWLEDSISAVGGHSRPAGGHRRVSGLVRASLKEETRKLMQEQLAEYYEPQDHSELKHMVKTIKSIKEISADNLEPGLFLIDDGEEESQTSTAADIAFPLAVDNRVPTVFFSLEKKEDDIVRDLLTILFSRYTDNIAGLGTAPQEEWDKAKNGIITLSKAPLFIDDSPDLSIDEMRSLAKVIISEGKERLFIIDGIHLLEEENPIKQLEGMAADLNVTIIALRKHNTQ